MKQIGIFAIVTLIIIIVGVSFLVVKAKMDTPSRIISKGGMELTTTSHLYEDYIEEIGSAPDSIAEMQKIFNHPKYDFLNNIRMIKGKQTILYRIKPYEPVKAGEWFSSDTKAEEDIPAKRHYLIIELEKRELIEETEFQKMLEEIKGQ